MTGNIWAKGDANLKAENFKKGINIFGITGTYERPALIETNILSGGFKTWWATWWSESEWDEGWQNDSGFYKWGSLNITGYNYLIYEIGINSVMWGTWHDNGDGETSDIIDQKWYPSTGGGTFPSNYPTDGIWGTIKGQRLTGTCTLYAFNSDPDKLIQHQDYNHWGEATDAWIENAPSTIVPFNIFTDPTGNTITSNHSVTTWPSYNNFKDAWPVKMKRKLNRAAILEKYPSGIIPWFGINSEHRYGWYVPFAFDASSSYNHNHCFNLYHKIYLSVN